MSEKIIINSEHHNNLLPMPEQHKILPSAETAEPLRPGELDPIRKLEKARTNVEKSAKTANPFQQLETAEQAQQSSQPQYINSELKSITLRRELQLIRHKLPAPIRTFSKFIHQPTIRAVSETTSKSITRPSGLLGGGLVAFLGSCGYLFLTKYIGLTYNYFVFLLLFIAGFIVGLLLELIIWVMITHRHPTDF